MSESLVSLAFFDLIVSVEIKRKMVEALEKPSVQTSVGLRGGEGAERAEAQGPTTFRDPTNLHFSKLFFAKNIFDF